MTHPTVEPGALIGDKYRLARALGTGGMGTVYEAQNEVTGKRVAIKCLHPRLAHSAEHVARMLREAQASSRIRHPNVVDVYDVGREGDSVFLVMEYLEGETLAAAMARGDLSVSTFIARLLPAMRGVAAAHALGIIHRDIKPDNIFLARVDAQAEPLPKVLDFGISKLPAEGGDGMTLTATGVALGTPLYMSYEQLNGARRVDARTDVYAFGVILYEGLTGHTPFSAQTLGALAIQLATETPRVPSAERPDVPRALDAIVMRAIARHREERYASLNELITALEPFATPAATTPHTPMREASESELAARTTERTTRAGAKRWMWLAVGAALLALLAKAYALLIAPREPELVVEPPPAEHAPAAIAAPTTPAPAIRTTPTPTPAAESTPAALMPTTLEPAAAPSAKANSHAASTSTHAASRSAHVSATPATPNPSAIAAPAPAAAATETTSPPANAEEPSFRAGRPKLDEF